MTMETWAQGARALVVGCGGVGGCTIARLLDGRARHVVGVAGNPEIARAIGTGGLTARLPTGERNVRIDVVTHASALPPGPYDLAFLAVPPNKLEEAALSVLPFLGERGRLVTLANGLPEERVAQRLEALTPGAGKRVVGCIVGFGASMLAPGVVEQTSDGGYTVGTLDGVIDEDVERVAQFLGRGTGGDVEVTTNLRGARWSKLAINCAISSLGTIGGDRLGVLMRHRFGRRLCLEVMTEVTQVAVALGVRLEKVSGTLDLEWIALDDEERRAPGSPGLFAKHTVLLAVGAKYRRLRSSMLQAIERGREPPIDYLNGEVVLRAPDAKVPVPVNTAVVERVKMLARGERAPSLDELRRLFDDTRPILKSLSLAA